MNIFISSLGEGAWALPVVLSLGSFPFKDSTKAWGGEEGKGEHVLRFSPFLA